ncbi:MAG: NAD(P)/FAD-dependent oxidoreductase [Bacteroidaceae bacterium]|nr:NAD(P)/FAD-dependent oxidoreductase [Bacteroidaceae bacterium]
MPHAIIGGGAAGFFLAIHLKERRPQARVVIVERSRRVLTKVGISGGGRCNVTNSFEAVSDLRQVYPRGARLLKRLFRDFDHRDAYAWFEAAGVPLVTQDDHCVFPKSQESASIILALTRRAQALGVEVVTGVGLTAAEPTPEGWRLRTTASHPAINGCTFDSVAITTGGAPRGEGHDWLAALGHAIERPCPSLFTFAVAHPPLTDLMGIVVEGAQVALAGTKLREEGALLITHWGLSGPAVLKLSAQGARLLAERDYRAPLLVSWIGTSRTEEALALLQALQAEGGQRQVGNVRPPQLQSRLWHYLLERADLAPSKPWAEVGRKSLNRLATLLTADVYDLAGRGTYKDEFVTCGGVALSSVDPATLESRHAPGLFFAGEVLDIDGVTGGFNFTAAWTTAFVAARGMARE